MGAVSAQAFGWAVLMLCHMLRDKVEDGAESHGAVVVSDVGQHEDGARCAGADCTSGRYSGATRYLHRGPHAQCARVGVLGTVQCPIAAYRASVATFCGRHQSSWSRYQAIVDARPASKSS